MSDWVEGGLHAPDFGDLDSVLVVLGAVVVLGLLWFLVFPLVVFLLDLVLGVLLAAAAFALRVVLRRPWIVEAHADGEEHTWKVVGLRAARRAERTIVEGVRLGATVGTIGLPPT